MLRCTLALALATLCVAAATLNATPNPVSVYPIRNAAPDARVLTLNGTWDFAYHPRVAKESPADITLASTITVPGHWELQGYCAPKYRTPVEGTGYYRRTFRVPADWRTNAQRTCLRFDGVLYGFDLWINGRPAGTWGSAYNPVTFDITDLLNPDATDDNTIEVRVTTRNKGWEFDTNDCWGISGIYRDVTLFAVPATHLENFSTRTTLNTDGTADLYVAIQATAEPRVHARLLAPDGKLVSENTTTTATQFHVEHPQLWTAETPHLYTLEITLLSPDSATTTTASIQTITQKIGLRQITIDGPVLKLNGTPIKLRGVDHHDIWPETGRACTDAQIRRDLELMRDANINFIRTSHYPPHPRLLDLADELGFYVMCEVPFGFGDKHLTDPTYQDILYTRARATVARDQNHPSIIVWSVGNENPITDIQLETGREVKRLDPTRPICFPTVGSYFEKNYEKFPDFVDIYAPHYPSVKTLTHYAATLQRPVIVTEYAHALGLATERLQALWEIMRTSPNIAGGAIWMFQDQGLLREGDINDPELAKQPYVWPDEKHYYDTGKTDGMDGIVYSDRRPQTDYDEVRKVYSPVVISEQKLTADHDTKELLLHIENRFDFITLNDYRIYWKIETNGRYLTGGLLTPKTAAGQTDILKLPLNNRTWNPWDMAILAIECVAPDGNTIYERHIKIENPEAHSPTSDLLEFHEKKTPQTTSPTIEKTDSTIRIKHATGTITLARATGQITIANAQGRTLVSGIYPHTGRRFTEADKTRVARNPDAALWPESYLTKATSLQTDVIETEFGPRLTIRGKYTSTYGSIEGQYMINVSPNGGLVVYYNYKLTGKGSLLEAGLTLLMPSNATEFRWLGLGPLPSSPGKQTAAEYGRYHLTRGDINFSGNRRATEIAAVHDRSGEGIILGPGEPADIAIEAPLTSDGGNIALSHNAIIASRGNKGAVPEHELTVEKIQIIEGTFALIPLENNWGPILPVLLGPATERVKPNAPYLRSYDQ